MKQYQPSPAKFSSTTTNKEHFPAHPPSPTPLTTAKPYRKSDVPFDDRTTTKEHFPAHQPTSPGPLPVKQYQPSPAKFSSATTNKETYPAHEPPAKMPPIGLWVENDRVEILLHSGAELPARCSRMFSTTSRDQTAVAVRFVQGWSRRASQCALLGVFEMDGIRPGPPGRAQIKITVTVEKDGTLVVEGTDADSGMTKSAQAKAALR